MGAGLLHRLTRVVGQPWLLWTLAGVFAVRAAFYTALAPDRPDARDWWAAGRVALVHPGDLYPMTAAVIARTHRILLPGAHEGLLATPAQALLAVPYALLPERLAVQLWTLTDAVAMLAALLLLHRAAAPAHRAATPLFWLLAAFFPPLFADLDAGQRGGAILLFAMAAFALQARRPFLAGVAGGISGSLKLYPLAMGLGNPRLRFLVGLGAGFVAFTAISFIPFGDPLLYLRGVLLPAAGAADPDCGIASVPGLWQRALGGQAYLLPGGPVRSPIHLPLLATALTALTDLTLVGAALFAARRSGWSPLYGMALGLALGALLPGEVYPYQWLPLLPLVLLVATRSVDARAAWPLGLLLLALLGFLRQPCDLPFPNVWAVAGLAVYAIAVWHHGLFRPSPRRNGNGDQ